MKIIVKYVATDPYYSDIEQTYIGATAEEVDNIRQETEEYMAREHNGLLSMIYKTEVVFDNTLNI